MASEVDVGIVGPDGALVFDSLLDEEPSLNCVVRAHFRYVIGDIRDGVRIVVRQARKPGQLGAGHLGATSCGGDIKSEVRNKTRQVRVRIKQRKIYFRDGPVVGTTAGRSISGDSILRVAHLEFIGEGWADDRHHVSADGPSKSRSVKRRQRKVIR